MNRALPSLSRVLVLVAREDSYSSLDPKTDSPVPVVCSAVADLVAFGRRRSS
jgi:hypothetical protein